MSRRSAGGAGSAAVRGGRRAAEAPPTPRGRVLVVHETRLVGAALSALLAERTALDAAPSCWESGAADAAALRPRVCVAYPESSESVGTLSPDGTLVRQLRRARCPLVVLVDPRRVGTLRRALDAGAQGFVYDQGPPEQLLEAVREVTGGRRYVAEEVRQGLTDAARMPVTRRELQVLRHAAAGASVAETAAALHLAPGTVRNYLNSGIRRLGARNKTDAVRAARETGWLLVPRPSGHGADGAGSRNRHER